MRRPSSFGLAVSNEQDIWCLLIKLLKHHLACHENKNRQLMTACGLPHKSACTICGSNCWNKPMTSSSMMQSNSCREKQSSNQFSLSQKEGYLWRQNLRKHQVIKSSRTEFKAENQFSFLAIFNFLCSGVISTTVFRPLPP